jgi:phosphoglycolate phosphatase-like HAD superfamily hydrolase
MTTADLPSWNDGPARQAILDFVARVTDERGVDYVRPTERIAVFDNDGTLWCEQPMQVQVFFLADRVRELVSLDPGMRERQPFKAFLEHDLKTLHGLGKPAVMELFASTHAGMADDEFDEIARAWFAIARHPTFKRPYTELVYRPQLELLEYLRKSGFKTFIVSGGGIDLIRAFAENAYGIPPERVIGSSAKVRLELHDDRPVLMKLGELNSFDDREAKAQNIRLHIGRRPILAFGNSDGDLAMMRYTLGGPGARLALLLHHDDAAREVAYDRDFKLSPLREALDKAGEFGITLVSMQRDWKEVFPA